MNPEKFHPHRRLFFRALAGAGAVLVAGCDKLSRTEWFPKLLSNTEIVTRKAQRIVLSRKALAQEFPESERSPEFRSNGTARPNNPQYQVLAENGFAAYSLEVGGLVEDPSIFSLEELRALPSRTQITRHDCVEGWSAIGKWKGVPLKAVLDKVRPAAGARFVMFYCADPMESDGTSPYYESIDMDDAYHPQTILAYELNGKTLPMANGAPIRLRVERQLGYKHAKYIMRIELVDSFEQIAGGKGGYWEDQGYEWYAGI